ncbi:MAG: PcfJ domain-containing protein [Eubacteriales bacterium]|nr:PcfJ domain-containing protein [Eubacteriales bacterium]
MDRSFLIHSEKENGWYCGKCGKRVLPDFYNAQMHAKECGFELNRDGNLQSLVEDDTACYRLRDEDGALHLEICRPELVRIRGFADRFHGLSWDRVLDAVFPADAREPVITENRSGADLDTWLSLIRADRCPRIHAESDVEVIRRVFPGIIGIFSLQMFVHIYRMKGYRHTRLISDAVAKRVMMTDPVRLEKELAERQNRGGENREGGNPGGENPGRGPRGAGNQRGRNPGREPRDGENPGERFALNASLLRYRDTELILRITAFIGVDAPVSFLFSPGFAACSEEVDLTRILQNRYFLIGNSEKAIRRFAGCYPEYYLEQYLERSSNVFVPLIGPDYHCLLELAAKANVPVIADNMKSLPQFEKDPSVCRNLREVFYLPVRILRALDRQEIDEEFLRRLGDVYRKNPALMQFDRITQSMCDFYQSLNIRTAPQNPGARAGAAAGVRQYRIQGLEREDFTDTQIHQILRYLLRRSESWEYLRDYLNACELLEEYPYGLLPKMPLREAHDRVVERIRLKKVNHEDFRFQQAVQSELYISLTTNETEEDKETFREDPYMIIAPKTREDMFFESEGMRNCVRTYVNRVVNNSCKIFFLRKKEEPEKPFGTIEVRSDMLVQAKGFGNSSLDQKAQEFIRKWCTVKRLQIRTHDIRKVGA